MEKTILVVDDELAVRNLLYDALTKVNFKVTTISNGADAIEVARKQKPDLILLDFKLAGMDGLETLKRIRSFDRRTKIIMLTGMGSEELEREARLQGASGFLRKTLGIDVIVKAINNTLEAKKGRQADKILVVDDDRAVSSLIKDFLQKKGFNVSVASSGEEALGKFKAENPLLVLLDVKLPGMDGMVTLKRLREIDEGVGVIMVTGARDQETFEEAKKLGAYEYIVKPFDLEYLETCVMVRLAIVSALID